MNMHFIKKVLGAAVLFALTLTTAATAHAATDGELKVSSTTLNLNDDLTITFSTKVNCKIQMRVIHEGNPSGQFWLGPTEFKVFNPPAQYKVKLTKAGKYRVWAYKLEEKTCGNMITQTDMMKDVQVVMPVSPGIANAGLASPVVASAVGGAGISAPGQCPDGYIKDTSTSMDEVKKGALRCVKNSATCPQGWVGTMELATGVLTCSVANPPTCPAGWQGSAQTGKLVCTPLSPVKVACPSNTPDWQWGTKYYSESWHVVGCSPNPKPAY